MDLIPLFLYTLGVILAAMTALWLVSLALRDASIVDIFWGAGFALANAAALPFTAGDPARKALATALVTVWGLRLALHLFFRNRGKGEDPRYRRWREEAGARWWWLSYVRVFLLQGVIMWLVGAPLLLAQTASAPPGVFDLLGAALWALGITFEAVGDWQLARFKADPANKGRLMTTGLWALTRHPNYFGDALVWWGHFALALAAPWGVLTVFAPVLMTFLLMRVSGVPLLESAMKQRPGYAEYVRNTPAFFPRLWRKL